MNQKPSRIERSAHLRWVPVADIKINPLAQREFRPAHAQNIASNFDPDAFQYPVVNHRGDHYWCVDGQHTVGAFRIMGWEDQQVQCVVHEGLSEAQEARLFLKLNNKKTVEAFDKFRIAVTGELEREEDINRIVLANRLKVSREQGGIGAVTALGKVYDSAGPVGLGRTLRIIRDSYGEAGFESSVIEGVGLVVARYNGEFVDAVATAKLAKKLGGVGGLVGRARQIKAQFGKPLPQCVAAAVVETYNAGRGGKKLPSWWKP